MLFHRLDEEFKEKKAFFTASEIYQQPMTWKKTIQQIKDQKDDIQAFLSQIRNQQDYDIILAGAGTSEFVGNSLFAYLNKKTDFKCKSYGTTDLVLSPTHYLSPAKPTLLISFGRSGNSPESIGAVDAAEAVCTKLYHLFITCNHEGALSKRALIEKNCYAINLCDETHDQSFAMTSSYTNMVLACLLCFELDRLDEVENEMMDIITHAERFLKHDFTMINDLVHEYAFDRIVYLGSNTLKGVAQESALKMLELTAGKVTTMYDTPLGFRHGPKSILNDQTLTVIYLSDDPYVYQYELDLIKEMSIQRKGNKILAIGNTAHDDVKELVDGYYSFHGQSHENVLLGLDYILIAQCMAFFKSLIIGITPDNPCPSGEVNRVVKGVVLYPFHSKQ